MMDTLAEATRTMVTWFKEKRVIAFIGAGTSMSAPTLVPGWKQCFEQLCDKTIQYGKRKEAELAKKVADLANYDPRYLTVAFDELRSALTDGVYHRSMQDILKPQTDTDFPSSVEILVKLPFWAYITTNIDCILENAAIDALKRGFRDETLRPIYEGKQIAQEVGDQRRQWLWKIHGTINNPDTWIFTAAEYWRSIYSERYFPHREIIRTIAQSYNLLFVGFGGSDLDLDLHLDHITRAFGGQANRHILLMREISAHRRLDLSKRNIDVIEYGGPADHRNLIDFLNTLNSLVSDTSESFKADCLGTLRNWTRANTSTLDLKFISPDLRKGFVKSPIKLEEVYIQLRERLRPGHLGVAASSDVASGRMLGIGEAIISSSDRVVAVLGPAGSGKSTLLKHISQSILSEHCDIVPIYIQLPEFIDFLEDFETGEDILPFIAALCKCIPYDIDDQVLIRILEHGKSMWLMDGMDELHSHQQKQCAVRLINTLASALKHSRFVLASRPSEIMAIAKELYSEACYIDALSDDDIQVLTSKWIELLLADIDEDRRKTTIDRFLQAFELDAGFRELSRSPAMLTLMLFVFLNDDSKSFPSAKINVLETVIDWLLKSREHYVGKHRMQFPDVKQIYSEIALAMYDKRTGADPRISTEEALRLLQSFTGEKDTSDCLGFFESELEHGLFAKLSGGDIGFSLKQFHDYLAAFAMASRSETDVDSGWRIVSEHLDDRGWGDVISLFLGCLSKMDISLSNKLFCNIAESIGLKPLDERIHAFTVAAKGALAARVVEEAVPEEGPWINLKRSMVDIFNEDGIAIPIGERVVAATAYGLLGDDRFRDEDSLWIAIPAEKVLLGAQPQDKGKPNYDELALPWEAPVRQWDAPQFRIHRFPITVEEYRAFFDDGGYRYREFWDHEAWKWLTENRITQAGNWYRQLDIPNSPITEVSWFEACAYCRWLTKMMAARTIVRLPQSDEWEHVAKKTPFTSAIEERQEWLSKAEDNIIGNWSGVGLWHKTSVGLFPKSHSFDGVADLFGNVEEWCQNAWPIELLGSEQERDLGVQVQYGYKIVRGGSAIRVSRLCRPTYYSRCNTEGRYPTIGFRPVALEAQ